MLTMNGLDGSIVDQELGLVGERHDAESLARGWGDGTRLADLSMMDSGYEQRVTYQC